MAINISPSTIVSPDDPASLRTLVRNQTANTVNNGIFQTTTASTANISLGTAGAASTGNLVINTQGNRSVVLAGIDTTTTSAAIVDSVSILNTDKEIHITGIDQGTTQQFVYNTVNPLVPATINDLGVVRVGDGLVIDGEGTLSLSLPQASTTVLGGVKVDGTSIVINSLTGVISATGGGAGGYTLPVAGVAPDGNLGGVKIGNNLIIDQNGVLSASPHNTYLLETAQSGDTSVVVSLTEFPDVNIQMLTLVGGTGIGITKTDDLELTFENKGVTKFIAGTGISLSSSNGDGTGEVTISASGGSGGVAGVTSVGFNTGTTGLTVSGTNPIVSTGTFTLGGVLSVTAGGTGTSSISTGQLLYGSGTNSYGKLNIGAPGQILGIVNGLPAWVPAPASGGTGTVTQVNASGGTTGLTFTGGPITTTGTLTLGGTLSAANGGTGVSATSTADLFSKLLPDQTGNDGKFLTTNSGVPGWADAPGGVTYDIASTSVSGGARVVLSGSDSSVSNVTFSAGSNVSISQANNVITISSTATGGSTGVSRIVAGTGIEVNPVEGTGDVTISSTNTTTGTVTLVNVSGGTTGLTTSGGPITASGTITIGGTLNVVSGGTGKNTYNVGDMLYATGAGSLGTVALGTETQVLTIVGGTPTWSDAAGGSGTTYTFATSAVSGGANITLTDDSDSSIQSVRLIAGSNISITNDVANKAITINSTGAAGGVSEVDVSGGTTGLTFTGGPITDSGVITMAGTLSVSNGGTGATDAETARTNLGLSIGTDVQGALTLTTTGTSGAATLTGNVLNIPQYVSSGGGAAGVSSIIAGPGISIDSLPGDGTGDVTISATGGDGTYGFRAAQGNPNAGDDSNTGYAFGPDGDTGMFSPGSGASNGVITFYSNDAPTVTIDDSKNLSMVGGGSIQTTTITSGSPSTNGSLIGKWTVPSGSTLTLVSPLGVTSGGTGLSSVAKGDVLYSIANNMLGRLPISTTDGYVLTANTTTGVPEWRAVPGAGGAGTGTVTSVGISSTDLTVSGTNPITSSGTISLGLNTVGVAKGGTGQTSYAVGDILYASAAGTLSRLAAGSDNDVLTITGGVPSWSAAQGGTSYTLPTASASVLGGVKVGSGLVIDGNGVLSANAYTLPTASTTVLGGVKVDGSTITIANGVISAAAGSGTVTNVDASGGTTGLSFTGGPITSDGTLTLGGTLGAAHGGTGFSTYTKGDLLYSTANNTLGKLPIGTTVGNVLTIAANNTLAWTSAGTGTVTSVGISGGTTGLTASAAITTSGTITLSGTLNSANGGTGFDAYAKGDIVFASAANTLSKLTVGSEGQVLTVNASGVPVWAEPIGGTGGSDTNTTYTVSAETVSGGASIALTGSDSSVDSVKLAAGSNVTITRTDASTITIASTASGGGSSAPEIVVFKYTTGSGGNLSGADSTVSTTSGVTATVTDGANSIVQYTFTGKSNPPKSITAYGQVCSADGNQQKFVVKDVTSYSTAYVDGGTSLTNPTFVANIASNTFTSNLVLQTTMANVGASAGLGQRAHVVIVFGF